LLIRSRRHLGDLVHEHDPFLRREPAGLLDFHYSDDWADGDKQLEPKAWAKLSMPDQAKAL
jgi:hypothetical protein